MLQARSTGPLLYILSLNALQWRILVEAGVVFQHMRDIEIHHDLCFMTKFISY